MSIFSSEPKLKSGSIFSDLTSENHNPFDVSKLADRFRYRDTGWSIPQAYLAILFLAADADGSFGVEERSEIELVARRSPALRALLDRRELGMHEQAAINRIAQNKETAFDEACQTLPADMCMSVFAHCVDIALSDGGLVPAEAKFLEQLTPKLDIEPEHARRIVEVLLLKARY